MDTKGIITLAEYEALEEPEKSNYCDLYSCPKCGKDTAQHYLTFANDIDYICPYCNALAYVVENCYYFGEEFECFIELEWY